MGILPRPRENPVNSLHQLGNALLHEHNMLLGRWRGQVRNLASAKHLDTPTLNDHIPAWLRNLADGLLAIPDDDPQAAASPLAHGVQRFDDGFDIEEVVSEYNILRDCVYDLAEERGIELRGRSRHILDRVFDGSIGAAVKSFAESQARAVQRRRVEHLAFVAHDLRTPLSAINFAAHLLERRIPAEIRDAETSRLLKTLGRNAKQLDTLVAHVLHENTQLMTELAVQVERRTFDLWPMVEALLQDLQPLALKNGTRLVNGIPDELELHADATLVRRILQNLVANAIAYSPAGEVCVGARNPGMGLPVECWVKDNGAGIPSSRIDSVFDTLETDPERDGTGLGLAIVKTFVEAHQGTVSVESVEGAGSRFSFTLPWETTTEMPATDSSRAAEVERSQ
jgi:two-component system, OmpR family, phosphate regulon sensor histidine kinase PhoR